MLIEGSKDAKLAIVTDFPRYSAAKEKKPLWGFEKDVIDKALLRAGLHPSGVLFVSMLGETPKGKNGWTVPKEKWKEAEKALSLFLSKTHVRCIVSLGSHCLKTLTGYSSIDKMHLSPLNTNPDFSVNRLIPTYHPDRLSADMSLKFFLERAIERAIECTKTADHPFQDNIKYQVNPPFEEVVAYLEWLRDHAPIVSNDIETGAGQINTVGFAHSAYEGMAIGCLPSRLSANKYYKLWTLIAEILESPHIGKIYQNLSYEGMFYSGYGIRCDGFYHDTMWANKVLWAEFNQGLDNVARLHTFRPYWKEDNKQWDNVKDWQAHYRYNVKDTTGTFAAHMDQKENLIARGLHDFFYDYVMRLAKPLLEMCTRGLPVNPERHQEIREKVEKELEELNKTLREQTGEDINPRSSEQVKTYLKSQGYKLYKVFDSPKKRWRESVNEKSLKKMRRKYPEVKCIDTLLRLAKLNKANSSYLKATYHPDHRMRYQLKATGTETLRFAGNKDPWGHGVNPQTIPGGVQGINIKKIFEAPEGRLIFQVDLAQAESRYVAYESRDTDLINMLEDPEQDVHKYVASEIFKKSPKDITKNERQLGKKSGHGANYDLGPKTFADDCLKEMDWVMTPKEAKETLEAYHRLFIGPRKRQREIRAKISKDRRLDTPTGWHRYFYGRLNDDLFREAYAFAPQHTIPYITNRLMFYLLEQRASGEVDFDLLLQVHDSLVLEINDDKETYDKLVWMCQDTQAWHPEIILPAGKLIIPTECEIGTNYGEVKEYEPGQEEKWRA